MNYRTRSANCILQLGLTVTLLALSIGSNGLVTAAGEETGVQGARGSEPKRVLIVTGEDYQGHKWQQTTPAVAKQLETDERLSVDVLADLSELRLRQLSDYNVVVMHFKNYDAKVPGRDGFNNLKKFVESGGGLVLIHFACGAFEEFKGDFEKLAGRVWIGLKHKYKGRHQHDPYGPFTVEIAATDHPITRGMTSFKTTDELYACLEGETPITVLATAVSKVDGERYPMAFVLTCGKGRVFHCVLGHDVRALEKEGAADFYRRGTAWTARLDLKELQ